MILKFITVFTPAYNRAYCLHRVYESLLKQTNQNFIWLVVDDGSTDNTKQLVQKWIEEQEIDIHYIYKTNGGMHTAHNTAYKNINTELNVCIDSDDSMPVNAVESILSNWEMIKDKKNIVGMIGLDNDYNGELIGSCLPDCSEGTTLGLIHHKYNVTGDKKLVYKSSITKNYPSYPEYSQEKLVPLGTLYTLIDRDYLIIPINEVWVNVDYQQDGSSATINEQYFKSPKGFLYCRRINLLYGITIKNKFRNAIHYVSTCMILKDYLSIIIAPKPMYVIPAIPFGLLLNFYIFSKRKSK
jgi:glycosyltransferase involved in cell wall biosynthesis